MGKVGKSWEGQDGWEEIWEDMGRVERSVIFCLDVLGKITITISLAVRIRNEKSLWSLQRTKKFSSGRIFRDQGEQAWGMSKGFTFE